MNIVLDRATRTLQIALAGAVAATQADVTASYVDKPAANEGEAQVVTNGATSVLVVDAPPAGQKRHVSAITVVNRDSAAITPTLSIVDSNGNTTTRLATVQLAVGDQLSISEQGGVQTIDASGEVKSSFAVPTSKLASSENAFIRTDAGVKDLLVAAANDRIVTGVITVTTAFADGDGTQPTLTIGEEGGSASKFSVAADLTGKAANTKIPFAGTLTGSKKLQGTLVAATGTTSTGAYRIDVHAAG